MKSLSRFLLGLWVSMCAVTSVSYAEAPACQNIVDLVAGKYGLSKLKDAVIASGLAASLNGPGPITVFAPNDEAFQKAPFLGDLLPEQVNQVLLGHIIVGTSIVANSLAKCSIGVPSFYGSGLTQNLNLLMANGKTQRFCPYTPVEGAQFGKIAFDGTFGGAKILETNIRACNGIVHVIDTVLQ